MIAIEFRGEFAVRFESSCERLFEQHAMAGCNQSRRVLAMMVRRRDDHGGVANACLSQLSNRRKNRNPESEFIAQAAGAFSIQVGESGKLACLRVTGQFVQMKRVDRAHASEAGDGNF
jgi:hypothetical protein